MGEGKRGGVGAMCFVAKKGKQCVGGKRNVLCIGGRVGVPQALSRACDDEMADTQK